VTIKTSHTLRKSFLKNISPGIRKNFPAPAPLSLCKSEDCERLFKLPIWNLKQECSIKIPKWNLEAISFCFFRRGVDHLFEIVAGALDQLDRAGHANEDVALRAFEDPPSNIVFGSGVVGPPGIPLLYVPSACTYVTVRLPALVSSTFALILSRPSSNCPSQRSTFAFVPPAFPWPKWKKITSAFLPSFPGTLSCAFRIAEVTSTDSHFAGAVKENSPTLNGFGASAATVVNTNVAKNPVSK
jgi:hypothetical protein